MWETSVCRIIFPKIILKVPVFGHEQSFQLFFDKRGISEKGW